MIETSSLTRALRPFLARQRWYGGTEEPSDVRVVEENVEEYGPPALVRVLVDADGSLYQLLVGLRPTYERPEFLRGRDDAVIGEVDTDGGAFLAYDAVVDSELGLILLKLVTNGAESAERVRPVGAEQSNSSLVYDERLILKVFRRLHHGPNLDVEMTEALAESGFDHVARPLATWTSGDFDLAVVQPFLPGAVDAWSLALTSLRDLFGCGDTQPIPVISAGDPPPKEVDPADAGGDFSAEARRLGTITADMHASLIDAFGQQPGDAAAWADDIARQIEAARHPGIDKKSALAVLDGLRRIGSAGPATRVHGDYHLGQVLRTDSGWYVLDFEGEPARLPSERRRLSSPLRDVAGMVRSFSYASAVAQFERDEDCADLAWKWETRNRKAFIHGYLSVASRTLPDPASTEVLLAAFELEKAVYEVAYEQDHRPDWVSIPLAALRRLVA